MRRWFAGLVTCGLVAGCSTSAHEDDAPPVVTMELVSFDACADALDHLKREAHHRVGPWGLPGGDITGRAVPLAAVESTQDAAGSVVPQQQYSTTNVQEIGVDEPDIVKSFGQLLVAVSGSDLRVVDVSGATPHELSRLSLGDEHVDASLLFSDDTALVLVREHAMVTYDGPGYGTSPKQTTKLLVVDLSEPTNPVVESTLEVEGNHLEARMVGDMVRLVVSSHPDLAFPMTEEDWNRPEDELIARNREVIAESTIEDWLPSYRLTDDGEETAGELVSCERLSRPDDFAGFATLSVLTFDLSDGLFDDDAVGVLADGETVYASTERLYVATTRWGDPVPTTTSMIVRPAGDLSTGIHAFDISGDGPARYVASGEVDGRIIGRYAMSEYQGVLRVATTVQTGRNFDDTESRLVTLGERERELVRLGLVGDLGRGERIYAVRYVGPTGYVVTFRQSDPLYVLDLSDPADPATRGELKITGYSAYLHDVGDDRLVGVGQEATSQGVAIGAQISLFDVADPTSPAKLDGHVVPDAWSQAEWDPHAFLYWPDSGQLVVPIELASGLESAGALVLLVGDRSVTEQGVIVRNEDAAAGEYSSLLRSLVVGDTLYTVWQDGLQANSLDDLEHQGWIAFT